MAFTWNYEHAHGPTYTAGYGIALDDLERPGITGVKVSGSYLQWHMVTYLRYDTRGFRTRYNAAKPFSPL